MITSHLLCAKETTQCNRLRYFRMWTKEERMRSIYFGEFSVAKTGKNVGRPANVSVIGLPTFTRVDSAFWFSLSPTIDAGLRSVGFVYLIVHEDTFCFGFVCDVSADLAMRPITHLLLAFPI